MKNLCYLLTILLIANSCTCLGGFYFVNASQNETVYLHVSKPKNVSYMSNRLRSYSYQGKLKKVKSKYFTEEIVSSTFTDTTAVYLIPPQTVFLLQDVIDVGIGTKWSIIIDSTCYLEDIYTLPILSTRRFFFKTVVIQEDLCH